MNAKDRARFAALRNLVEDPQRRKCLRQDEMAAVQWVVRHDALYVTRAVEDVMKRAGERKRL